MDWWIIKQLRAMVLNDLQKFIPEDYFNSKHDEFVIHPTIDGATHFSDELRWGYLACTLGKKLFFSNSTYLSARQVAASDVLMNLGLLASAEAAHGSTKALAIHAKALSVSDGNAENVANQIENEQIPALCLNVKEALNQYLLYLSSVEQLPFRELLHVDQKQVPVNKEANQLSNRNELKHHSGSSESANLINLEDHQFDVAFSFPGEVRPLVSDISQSLESLMGRHTYFYDFNYQAQLARPSLDTLLQNIYRKKSLLIVVFLSSDYQRKEWCNIEFRAIREIILERNHEQIMFVRTDSGNVDGIFKTDGYIDANKFSSSEIAEFIYERVELLKLKKSEELNYFNQQPNKVPHNSQEQSSNKKSKDLKFELIESFPQKDQPISIDQLGRMFLKFNNPIDRNTACFIGILQPSENCFYQWDNSGGIKYSEENSKLTYFMQDNLREKEPSYSAIDDEFYRFEIHIGRGHPDTLVKDIFGNTLPHKIIPVSIKPST